MAKGNLFLGFGRGKVGDVVFSHQNGEQITRARNRSPHNPQTPLQLLQRVILKTSSQAFSLLQDICNHSFQGEDGVTKNQSAFVRRNVALFRNQLADLINSGDPDDILTSSESNFSGKLDTVAAINPYVVSAGTIDPIPFAWEENSSKHWGWWMLFDSTADEQGRPAMTYQDFIDHFGLMKGDQLTFLEVYCDGTLDGSDGYLNGFRYARLILEPDDGDMTHAIGDTTHANPRNEGVINWNAMQRDGTTYAFGVYLREDAPGSNVPYASVGQAVIVSRQVGGVWQRSNASLVLRPWTVGGEDHLTYDHGTALLSDAILSYMSDPQSMLYLNQAEV